jgi:hypothetical protein
MCENVDDNDQKENGHSTKKINDNNEANEFSRSPKRFEIFANNQQNEKSHS